MRDIKFVPDQKDGNDPPGSTGMRMGRARQRAISMLEDLGRSAFAFLRRPDISAGPRGAISADSP